MATEVSVTEFKGNATDLIKKIDSIKKHSKDLDDTLTTVLSHLQAIENGFKNVNKITNNISTKYNQTTFSLGQQKHIAKGSTGFISSDTGKDKLYREYEQALIDETKEITADIAERKKLRQQRANAETTKVNAEKERVSKIENQNSFAYQERMSKLAEAKLLNARNNQTGALLRNPRYQTGRALSAVGNTVSSIGVGGKLLGGLLDTVGILVKSPVAGTAAAVTNLAKGIKDLGSEAIKAFSEIQSIKTQLGIVYSSQTQANTAFSEISQYAVHSPFGIQQTSELAVLLKQSGVYASDLMDTLRMLGDTAGGNMEKMKRIANNYAQIMAIGKASMLDMRQFAYAGIPIFEAVSKELNVSQQQLRKLISDGKVTSDIIEKVFKDLTGINGIFENATEVGAKTLKARLQNLKDAQQLGFASIGEWGVSLGSRGQNDSYVNNIVSYIEKIWQDIHEKVDTRNIEKSVENIEKRDSDIIRLEKLIESQKKDNKDTKYLEKILDERKRGVSPDSDRATYVALYKAITDKFSEGEIFYQNRQEQSNKILELLQANSNIKKGYWGNEAINNLYDPLNWNYADANNRNFLFEKNLYGMYAQGAGIFGVNPDAGTDSRDLIEANKEQIQYLRDLIDVMDGLGNLQEKIFHAVHENNTLEAQQLAYDKTNKYSDASGSLLSSFQELTEIYKNSEEYKEKEEAERQQTLKAALEELKKIKQNTDDDGRVAVGNISDSDLYKYYKAGAFKATTNLRLATGDAAIDKQNRTKLESQLFGRMNTTIETLQEAAKASGSKKYIEEIDSAAKLFNSLSEMDDETFYLNFSKTYDLIKASFDKLKGMNQYISTYIDRQKELLDFSTNTIETEVGGDKITEAMLASGLGKEFIPLWKRILAQATGLSAEGIKNTKDTLDNYHNDMAVRNITSSVMTAVIKSSDISSAMFLARPTNILSKLQGAPDATVQIDWKNTREAVKNFATQLSASTEVVTAYKNALEEEYNTLISLVAAGYSTPESQDISKQKWISSKEYSRIVTTAGSQLVNAFGADLKTTEGKSVWLQNDGKFYDVDLSKTTLSDEEKKAHEVQVENLVVTESLFEIIKETLPEIESELHEANTTLLKNTALEEILKEVKGTQLLKRLADYSSPVSGQVTSFFTDNPDKLISAYDSAIKVVRNQYKDEKGDYLENYKWLEGMSDNDLLMAEITGKGGENAEHISYIIEKTLEKISSEWESFVTDGYINGQRYQSTYASANDIKNRKAIDDAVNAKLQRALGLDSKELTTDKYGGARGERNFLLKALGFDMSFDKEDILAGAVRSGAAEAWGVKSVTQMGSKFIEDDQELAKQLSYMDKLTIMLHTHFEDIQKTVEDLTSDMLKATQQLAQGAWLAPFEQLGDYLITGKDYADGLGEKMKQLGAELLSQMGTYMARAGFSLVEMGALQSNWGLVAGGLALAAAGGFASGLGGALKEGEKDKDKTDKQAQKLENLKSELQKLLEQARTDALYYENNLRHKNALGTNERFSYKSVHDAVITPQGVVETDPKDFLIATKTPQSFMGGGVTVQPVINCNVVNNTSAQVRQEQQMNVDGSIDIITIIEDVAGQYIASSKSDEAFGAREYRLGGKQAVM